MVYIVSNWSLFMRKKMLAGKETITVLRETTEWDFANGEYHLNSKGELVQYNDKKFAKPMKNFSKSYRKFKKVREYSI